MHRKKLGTCIAASLITLAGATYLAVPAHAANRFMPCGAADEAYAQGYADGYCTGQGSHGGTVTSCNNPGDGGQSTFTFYCY
jgi:hypothetical protein